MKHILFIILLIFNLLFLSNCYSNNKKEFIKQLKVMKDASELVAKFKKYEPLLKTFLEEHEGEIFKWLQ